MNYSFHDKALGDVAAAQDFYFQNAGAQVATRFNSELARVIALLLEHPGFGTPMTQQRRIYPLKSFPFSVVYRLDGEELRILIVRHQRQKPNFATDRH